MFLDQFPPKNQGSQLILIAVVEVLVLLEPVPKSVINNGLLSFSHFLGLMKLDLCHNILHKSNLLQSVVDFPLHFQLMLFDGVIIGGVEGQLIGKLCKPIFGVLSGGYIVN